jgi:uncharacterized membrane protein
MRFLITTICLFVVLSSYSQDRLGAFDNLIGGRWKVKTNWSNGEAFEQETIFQWAFDRKAVKTMTYSLLPPDGQQFGLKSEGIRMFDRNTEKIRFWEFGLDGTIVEGTVEASPKAIHYYYKYGQITIRESWVFSTKDRYTYTIGQWHGGRLTQTYLQSTAVRISE